MLPGSLGAPVVLTSFAVSMAVNTLVTWQVRARWCNYYMYCTFDLVQNLQGVLGSYKAISVERS
jgi:hypothetical protein